MVTIQQVQQGLAKFVDMEVLPRLSGVEKVVVGGGAALLAKKLPETLVALNDNKIVAALGLYDRERGEIDIDELYSAMKPYLGTETIPVKLPMLGITLKFSEREIDTLYRYIKEA